LFAVLPRASIFPLRFGQLTPLQEEAMRSVMCAFFASAMLVTANAPANAAFQTVYEVLGVIDDGGAANAGSATTIYCTNLGGAPVNVRVRAFKINGDPQGITVTHAIPPNVTRYFSTHETFWYSDAPTALDTGQMNGGRARVLAETPTDIVCGADFVDASAGSRRFTVPRRMIRYPRAASGGED
jgi:hypothetical protein